MVSLQGAQSYFSNLLKENYQLNVNADGLRFSKRFLQLLQEEKFHFGNWFKEKPVLLDENGNSDYLGTAFYMLHCIQEYADFKPDKFGRFKYKESFQAKFDCVEENLVHLYLKIYLKENLNVELKDKQSTLLMTHDIDRVNGGLRQGISELVEEGKFFQIFSLILNHFKGKRVWRNIDKIIEFEKENNIKSLFFFIANNKYDEFFQMENGDYQILDEYIQLSIELIEKTDFEIGLHKSSNKTSFDQELEYLTAKTIKNRYHYLKFSVKEDFPKLSKSKIQEDYSLGFAEKMGFRNCYGLPFTPYDIKKDKPFNFTAVPLHIMDTTFETYLRISKSKTQSLISNFITKNISNSQISVLLHNDKFFDFLNLFPKTTKWA